MPPLIKAEVKPISGKILTVPIQMGKSPAVVPAKPLIPAKPPIKPIVKPVMPKIEGGPDTRPILIPEIMVNGIVIPLDKLKIGFEKAVKILGWENESSYKARLRESGVKTPAGYGDDFVLRDPDGEKVRFFHNAGNRDFDLTQCMKLVQDILEGNYYLNLETIIISKFGNVTSGQHRLAALIYAVLLWRSKSQHEYLMSIYWKEEPYILSLLAGGGSEDPKVLRTIDNCKARTLADVFFTNPTFSKMDKRERKEFSRYSDYAVDLLWKRTEFYASDRSKEKVYQTHSSSVDFYDKHPKLFDCISVMYKHNYPTRLLSAMRLSPGQCSALLYLMGSSASDPDNGYLEHRMESYLNWDNWDRAIGFWQYVVDQKADGLIFQALAGLKDVEESEGLGGRVSEKQAIIIKAWLIWVDNGGSLETLTDDDLVLEYDQTEDGKTFLVGWPTCGGIDFGGDKPAPPKPKQSKKEKDDELAAIEKIKADRAAKVHSIVNETPEQEKARRAKVGGKK